MYDCPTSEGLPVIPWYLYLVCRSLDVIWGNGIRAIRKSNIKRKNKNKKVEALRGKTFKSTCFHEEESETSLKTKEQLSFSQAPR